MIAIMPQHKQNVKSGLDKCIHEDLLAIFDTTFPQIQQKYYTNIYICSQKLEGVSAIARDPFC